MRRRALLTWQPTLDEVARGVKAEVAARLVAGAAGGDAEGGGDAALVFSSHPATLEAVAARLGEGRSRTLVGDLAPAARQRAVDDFQAGRCGVLLVGYQAGAEGINCQRANVVVLLNPTEDPSLMSQAACRAWRIGQTREVAVYRLAAEGTLEVDVLRRAVRKERMSRHVLAEEEEEREEEGGAATGGRDVHDGGRPVATCPDARVRALASADGRVVEWEAYGGAEEEEEEEEEAEREEGASSDSAAPHPLGVEATG